MTPLTNAQKKIKESIPSQALIVIGGLLFWVLQSQVEFIKNEDANIITPIVVFLLHILSAIITPKKVDFDFLEKHLIYRVKHKKRIIVWAYITRVFKSRISSFYIDECVEVKNVECIEKLISNSSFSFKEFKSYVFSLREVVRYNATQYEIRQPERDKVDITCCKKKYELELKNNIIRNIIKIVNLNSESAKLRGNKEYHRERKIVITGKKIKSHLQKSNNIEEKDLKKIINYSAKKIEKDSKNIISTSIIRLERPTILMLDGVEYDADNIILSQDNNNSPEIFILRLKAKDGGCRNFVGYNEKIRSIIVKNLEDSVGIASEKTT